MSIKILSSLFDTYKSFVPDIVVKFASPFDCISSVGSVAITSPGAVSDEADGFD